MVFLSLFVTVYLEARSMILKYFKAMLKYEAWTTSQQRVKIRKAFAAICTVSPSYRSSKFTSRTASFFNGLFK